MFLKKAVDPEEERKKEEKKREKLAKKQADKEKRERDAMKDDEEWLLNPIVDFFTLELKQSINYKIAKRLFICLKSEVLWLYYSKSSEKIKKKHSLKFNFNS